MTKTYGQGAMGKPCPNLRRRPNSSSAADSTVRGRTGVRPPTEVCPTFCLPPPCPTFLQTTPIPRGIGAFAYGFSLGAFWRRLCVGVPAVTSGPNLKFGQLWGLPQIFSLATSHLFHQILNLARGPETAKFQIWQTNFSTFDFGHLRAVFGLRSAPPACVL